MDREVHKYLKRQVSRNGNDYSKPAKTQRTINKLITSLHFGVRSKNSLKNSPSGKSMTSPDYLKVHTTIRKSHTWSGEFVILPTLHEQEVSNYSSSEESYKETFTNILDKEDEESGSASKSLELDLCGSVESISSVSDDYEDCRDVFQSQKEMNFTSMM
ncbi:uncharacterized protein LOC101863776 [Aplysia californica]|uniref:Uncharacterized protein LOC101863776 n=1 Tax=Aplysia californica TaxID=6500 RepID=A0ABM0K532_APLCA|nr:uncharacterized protein LOC101863776 [Aplysia californica]